MKTIELKGFVHCKPVEYGYNQIIGNLEYGFFQCDDAKSVGYALVAPYTLTLEIPDSCNPNGQFIEALEAEKKKVMAAFQNRITEIDRQISQFLAIDLKP